LQRPRRKKRALNAERMLYATEVADAVLRAVRGERERSRQGCSVL
jgi:hypothetical protein